eukprot:gene22543-30808_t
MTAAPPELGWPGHAVIYEMSGHFYEPKKSTKVTRATLPKSCKIVQDFSLSSYTITHVTVY